MTNQLEQLKTFTTVVADTGDFKLLAQFQPQDATTNPSLVLKTVQKPEYQHLLSDTVAAHKGASAAVIMDHLLVRLGCEILSLIPGRVSTEVDARLSFDTEKTIAKARQLVALYAQNGVDKERLLIKIASTWEGIQAAATLEREGIRTNLTLLFSLVQAVACAEAKVQLISPFVGRIYDWYKKEAGEKWDEAANAGLNDPGVQSVREIYHYYKHFDIPTEVMGASFRNVGQITALAGCDLLTISPELLAQLQSNNQAVTRQLLPEEAKARAIEPLQFDATRFKEALSQDAMASSKLLEGIAAFEADTLKLEHLIEQHRAA